MLPLNLIHFPNYPPKTNLTRISSSTSGYSASCNSDSTSLSIPYFLFVRTNSLISHNENLMVYSLVDIKSNSQTIPYFFYTATCTMKFVIESTNISRTIPKALLLKFFDIWRELILA